MVCGGGPSIDTDFFVHLPALTSSPILAAKSFADFPDSSPLMRLASTPDLLAAKSDSCLGSVLCISKAPPESIACWAFARATRFASAKATSLALSLAAFCAALTGLLDLRLVAVGVPRQGDELAELPQELAGAPEVMLHHVRQLVEEQPLARRRIGPELIAIEIDVVAEGECPRAEGGRRTHGGRVGVEADVREVAAKQLAHARHDRGWKRLPAIALVHERRLDLPDVAALARGGIGGEIAAHKRRAATPGDGAPGME
ncbi:MAG TPA: hypothetical protein VGD37_41100 [Kofleriaceae bacterium]